MRLGLGSLLDHGLQEGRDEGASLLHSGLGSGVTDYCWFVSFSIKASLQRERYRFTAPSS